MKNNLIKESAISILIAILAIALLNPFHFWMPNMLTMIILVFTLIAFLLLAIFVLTEKAQDEREIAHRMLSGRVAFLAGTTVLTFGLLVQGLLHTVDPWLVLALVVMVFTKILARIYGDKEL